jgi:hypothetical protein
MNVVTREEPRGAPPDDGGDRLQTMWHWIAVGTLLCCWIAEASMCGSRGF